MSISSTDAFMSVHTLSTAEACVTLQVPLVRESTQQPSPNDDTKLMSPAKNSGWYRVSAASPRFGDRTYRPPKTAVGQREPAEAA